MKAFNRQDAAIAHHKVDSAARVLSDIASDMGDSAEVITELTNAVRDRDEYINHLERRLTELRSGSEIGVAASPSQWTVVSLDEHRFGLRRGHIIQENEEPHGYVPTVYTGSINGPTERILPTEADLIDAIAAICTYQHQVIG